jgi:hypothetical protein
MTKPNCLRCGYEPVKLCHLKDHLKRKNKCEPKLMDISTDECLAILNQKDKDKVIELLYIHLRDKNKEIKNLQNQVNTLTVNQGNENRNVVGDHNKIDQSVHIHISVNSYEKTDYNVLKDKIHTCIKDGKVDESKLIKLLHFNKEHPENHNLKIVSKRDNRIQVFNGKEFEESCYQGKEGIWKLGQDTLKKTEKTQVLDEENLFNSIDDPDLNPVQLNEKRERTNTLRNVLFSGSALT